MIAGSFYCNSEFVRVVKLSRLLEILLLLVQFEKVIDFFGIKLLFSWFFLFQFIQSFLFFDA